MDKIVTYGEVLCEVLIRCVRRHYAQVVFVLQQSPKPDISKQEYSNIYNKFTTARRKNKNLQAVDFLLKMLITSDRKIVTSNPDEARLRENLA